MGVILIQIAVTM